MRLRYTVAAPVIAVLAVVIGGCTSGAPSDQDFLISVTDDVVVPAYQSVAQDMRLLNQDVIDLCTTPSDGSLESARQRWLDARESWLRSQAVGFGPVMELRSLGLIDWSPTDTEGVDTLLSGGGAITPDAVRNSLSSNRRGFGAIEHILFDENAVENLTGSSPYCSYLVASTSVMVEEAQAILSRWVDEADGFPAYRDYFTNRSDEALISNAAVADVVRTQVFLLRDIVDMRLATALGLREGGADLSFIPGFAADNGLEDIRNEITGMRAVYDGVGEEGLGLSHLVVPLSAETDERVRQQFDAALEAINPVEQPMRVAIAQKPSQVHALYERLSQLQRTISTEVVSLLGVSVGFTDTDGDSLR